MNPEALDHAYKLFVQDGYRGSKKDFYDLINSNPDALNRALELFQNDGYTGDVTHFSQITGIGQGADVGLKKRRYGIAIGQWFFGLSRD